MTTESRSRHLLIDGWLRTVAWRAGRRWLGAVAGLVVVASAVGAAVAVADDPAPANDDPVPAPLVTDDAPAADPHDGPRPLRVVGNQLIGPDGSPLRLIGVNRSGAEYACAQGWGIWDGAADEALVDTMASWGINSVRIPLNEHCWLDVNGVRPEFGGERYREAIVGFVELLNERGLIAVLDLHWSGPGDELALENRPMPNADHSAAFWRSVASTFAENDLVLFDLFNEPREVDWMCWRDGCTVPEGYRAAGMQDLVDAVRSTGAEQPIILSGLDYANDLSGWLQAAPTDPVGALIAGFHVYNFTRCRTVTCWDATVGSVAEQVPVVTAELGEDACDGGFTTGFMDWADRHDVSYMAWTFNAWDCHQGPALIVDDSGTPTAFGASFRRHVLELSEASS